MKKTTTMKIVGILIGVAIVIWCLYSAGRLAHVTIENGVGKQEMVRVAAQNALDGRELFEGDSDIADLFIAAAKAGLNYSKIRYSKTEEGETQ